MSAIVGSIAVAIGGGARREGGYNVIVEIVSGDLLLESREHDGSKRHHIRAGSRRLQQQIRGGRSRGGRWPQGDAEVSGTSRRFLLVRLSFDVPPEPVEGSETTPSSATTARLFRMQSRDASAVLKMRSI